MKTISSLLVRSSLLVTMFAASLSVQAATPAIALTSPPSKVLKTDQASIDLEGTGTSDLEVSNLIWTNGLGKRGSGTVTRRADNSILWSIAAVPLRMGQNFVSVTIVDTANRSNSLHLAINRQPVAGAPPAQPLPLGTGTWRNRPLVYQLWTDMAVVEGDIILGPATTLASNTSGSAVLSRSAISKISVPQAITGDGLAIGYTSQIWPAVGGVHQIPYVIQNGSTNLTTALNDFNAQFSGLLELTPRSGQANYVNINIDSGSSTEGFSNVGMIGNEQYLECGGGCSVATLLHEMGHTVGLLHEHQRPDRNGYITLNLANADLPNVPGNFTLFAANYQTAGLYDYSSVMHYGAFDFSKNGLPVIESIPAGIPLSNLTGYSAGDVDQIERLYGATPSSVTVTSNPVGLQIVVDGATYTAPQTFSWTLNSSHTLNLPADPQVTNPRDGSTYAFASWNDNGSRSHTISVQGGTGTLVDPGNKPGVTVYEANFIRLQPFAFLSPAVYPSGAGTVTTSPSPVTEYGGSFFTDRQLITLSLTATPNSGYNFYDWYNLPFPASDNPKQFFIQSPLTSAQAVFVSTPVTLVGESVTGPNTWNGGLAAYMDGDYFPMPAGFSSTYNGSSWNAGTTHALSTEQQQSPVTTNVFYNWNSWSDSGALSHNITQPSSGSHAITGSFTPNYAFYTIVSPNSSCAGTVTTSPAGEAYSVNTTFQFYADGTNVTTTATANSQYSGLLFAGWTGSLSGSTNPQTTAIHDQFVPTGNFNTIATPIAVTGYNPEIASATPNALNLTIVGTGFTPSTYTYWNGSYRANTYVTSTQITMHLNAGDLVAAGGQDVFVGNYPVNSSNQNCGLGFDSTFDVASASLSSYSISGQITVSGVALANVSVSLSNGATTTTNSAGNYSFTTLPAGATYTVTPGLTGYQFTPANQTFANLSANQTANFVAAAVSGPLEFVSVSPCRVVDTRRASGALGGPSMSAGSTRSFPVPTSVCGLPSTAFAYSFNVTVVPKTTLQYLTMWPTGQPQPFVSTLNSFDGRVAANAAILPAGTSGAVSVYVTDNTDVIIDVNGYFASQSTSGTVTFVPLTPCRVVDTRNANGTFGGPVLAANSNRSFPISSSSCNIPAGASAYSLNATVVPTNTLSYLTLYPTGAAQPNVSTLNSYNGQVVANAAIVPAGTSGAVTAYVTDQSQLILDINGYFAPSPPTPLVFTTVTPCRIVDTRNANGTFGGPIMAGNSIRSFPIPSGSCGIPSSASAYAFNVTVVPASTLSYLTLWPSGQTQPTVSTLNSYDGQVVANAALVPAGSEGAVDVFATDETQVIIDINGYFAPPNH